MTGEADVTKAALTEATTKLETVAGKAFADAYNSRAKN